MVKPMRFPIRPGAAATGPARTPATATTSATIATRRGAASDLWRPTPGPATRSPGMRRCRGPGRFCCRGLGRFCCRAMHRRGFVPVRKPFHHRRLGSSCVFHIRRDVSPAAGRPADAKNTTQRRAFPDFLLATPLQVLDGEHQQRVACPGRVPDHLAPVVHRHLLPLPLQGAAQQLAFQVVRRRIQRDLPAFPEFRVGLQPWRAARVQRAPGAPLCGSHVPIFARFSPLFRAKPYKNRTETVQIRTNSVHPQRSRKRADSHIPRGTFAPRAVTGDRNETHANKIRATPRRRCGCSQRPIQDSTARQTVRLLTDVTKLAARPQITPISSIFGPKFARNPAEFRQKTPKIRREYRKSEVNTP